MFKRPDMSFASARRFFLTARRIFAQAGSRIFPGRRLQPVKSRPVLSEKKRKELFALCKQLLKNKAVVASGKLQFIGLENVKKRLGKRWPGLRRVVYEIVDDIIEKHIDDSDIYFLYEEESYLIIFAQKSLEDGKKTVANIVTEVRERLFALDEKELRRLEIQETAGRFDVGSFMDLAFPEMEQDSFSGAWVYKKQKIDHDDAPITPEDKSQLYTLQTKILMLFFNYKELRYGFAK